MDKIPDDPSYNPVYLGDCSIEAGPELEEGTNYGKATPVLLPPGTRAATIRSHSPPLPT